MKRTRWWILGALALAAMMVAWALLPVGEWVEALQERLHDLGPWGVPLFIVVFVVGIVGLVPGVLFSLTAGAVYGLWGIPVAIGAATIGAALAFLIARHVAHDPVCAWMARRPRVLAVERAVSVEGWKIVALLRLNPLIPFTVQNYVLGVTDIPFTHYLAATFAGIIPGTILDVYIGTLGHAAAERGPLQWALLVVGLVVSLALVWLVARKAKRVMAGMATEAER